MSNKFHLNSIYAIFFSYLPIASFCDSPVAINNNSIFSSFGNFLDHLGFQEPASPLMEGLIALHSDIWAIMLFVAGFVLYMVCATLYSFDASNTTVSHKVHHHSLIEIVWTTIPAIILCIIAVPSFTLLYSLDEIVEPSLTIKAIGRQWYWSYEYGDYDIDSDIGSDIYMISPNESNSGWFSSMKTYWGFGKNNQPLSPVEANQKTLHTLQNAQKSTLDHCQKYDDSLIKGSLSPRSHDITLARRVECYFHYDALSQCSSQIASNIGSTDYSASAAPNTFTGSFGNALGQKVGTATQPLYTDMAKNAIITTAEGLSKQ